MSAEGSREEGCCLAHLCTGSAGSLVTRVFPDWPQGGEGEPGLMIRPSGRFQRWHEHWTRSQGPGC